MNPLLVSGFGTAINVENRRLVVSNKSENRFLEFYPHKIDHDSIIIDGYTGYISFEAMRWLSKHDISMTLLNWNGGLLSVSLPEQPKSGKLRINQYRKYLDGDLRFEIARSIVEVKVEKSLELLSILSEYYDFIDIYKIKKTIDDERNFLSQSVKKSTNDKKDIAFLLKRLMNYEGKCATVYLGEITKTFSEIAPEFNFQNRKNKSYSRNYNASDEINALFNYGYSILESEIRKAINTAGLDYSIGFLHEINQSRTSLVYDIQELFRWLIDLSITQLLEEKKLTKKDFLITENYNVRLKPKTAQLLIQKIMNNFNKKSPYKRNKNHTYQNILLDNVQMLANFVSDKIKNLEFNIPSIEVESSFDFKKIKQELLKMTPNKRKQLGINKSTLWYLKKGLESGKKPKIYKKVLEKLDTSLA